MKKLLSNKKGLSSLLALSLGIVLTVIAIIHLIQSYSYYSDEWGTDISFDEDYVLVLICSLILVIYGIFSIVNIEKDTSIAFHISFGLISTLLSFYPLGTFIKGLVKGKGYIDMQDYLYISIAGFVLLSYTLISYKKQKLS